MTYKQLKQLKAECTGRCYTACSTAEICDSLDRRQEKILGTVKKAHAWTLQDIRMLADSGITTSEEDFEQ